MSFQEFFNKYNGQQNVGNTTENKGECVGLVAVWIDVLNLPHIWGHAKDLFDNADEKYFEKILNTPDVIPQKGDIPIWSSAFNGTYGHTGIATGIGDLNTFECFEQNDPLGSNSHLKVYNYKFVIGWLRAKNPITDCDPNWRIERDRNWDLYQGQIEENKKLTERITILEGQVVEYKAKLESEQKHTLELNDQIADLAIIIQKIKDESKDYGQQIIDAEHDRDNYKSIVDSTSDALGSSTTLVSILKAIDDLKKPQDDILKDREKLLALIFNDLTYKRVPKWIKSLKEKIIMWFE